MIRYNPNIEEGLTKKQVEKRKIENLINIDTSVKTKSIKSIILNNTITIFNLLNIVFLIALLSVKSYKNLLFMGVVISNILISTIWEIKAKKTVDKLNILSNSKIKVIREKQELLINKNEIVLDDIVKYTIGDQIALDAIILKGNCEIDESFITGESNTIYKKELETVISGSFITSGTIITKVEHISSDNYMQKITNEAKYIKKIKSEIMEALNKLLKLITIIIIPLGALLFIHEIKISENVATSIISTIGALIGMIPEGLVLLVSTVFAVSTIKLSKKNILVKEMLAIETLARVNTFCFDKTGTITTGNMQIKKVIPLNEKYNINEIMGNFCHIFKEENKTLLALKKYFKEQKTYNIKKTIQFSSYKKLSSITTDKHTYTLGAPEVLIKDTTEIKEYQKDYRTLLLKNEIELIAIILIEEEIKKDAKKIIEYLNDLKIDIKIISGDSAITTSNIAKKCNIKNSNKYIDLQKITKKNYKQLVKNYTIFGRVSPKEKKELIKAIKQEGKTVGMTGDGVNDVLALKESSIAIGLINGMESSKNVSEFILLDSDYTHIIDLIKEGRQSINNIERSSILFITKTIYATILTILFLFINTQYPLIPIQLTLTNVLTIGIPSFLLALEKSTNIIKTKFIKNIISKSLPASLAIIINIIIIIIVGKTLNLNKSIISTMCVISNAFVGFTLLYKISKPLNKEKRVLIISLILMFLIAYFFFKDLFNLTTLNLKNTIIIGLTLLLSIIIYENLNKFIAKID